MKLIYGSIFLEAMKFTSMLGMVVGFVSDNFLTFVQWTLILLLSILFKESLLEDDREDNRK